MLAEISLTFRPNGIGYIIIDILYYLINRS